MATASLLLEVSRRLGTGAMSMIEQILTGAFAPLLSVNYLAFGLGVGLLAARSGRAVAVVLIACFGFFVGVYCVELTFQAHTLDSLMMISIATVGLLSVLQINWALLPLGAMVAVMSIFHGADFVHALPALYESNLVATSAGAGLINACVAISAVVWASAMSNRPSTVFRPRYAGAMIVTVALVLVLGKTENPIVRAIVA